VPLLHQAVVAVWLQACHTPFDSSLEGVHMSICSGTLQSMPAWAVSADSSADFVFDNASH